MSNIKGNISISNVLTAPTWPGTPFTRREPKSNTIMAVKLTKDSIREVAPYILKTIGGTVRVDDSTILAGPPSQVDGRPTGSEFVVGDWLVEEYDYFTEEVHFRTATLKERQEYDLR